MDSNIEYNRRAQKERLRKREENFKDLGRESPSKKARINGDKVFPKDDICNGKRNSLDSLEDAKDIRGALNNSCNTNSIDKIPSLHMNPMEESGIRFRKYNSKTGEFTSANNSSEESTSEDEKEHETVIRYKKKHITKAQPGCCKSTRKEYSESFQPEPMMHAFVGFLRLANFISAAAVIFGLVTEKILTMEWDEVDALPSYVKDITKNPGFIQFPNDTLPFDVFWRRGVYEVTGFLQIFYVSIAAIVIIVDAVGTLTFRWKEYGELTHYQADSTSIVFLFTHSRWLLRITLGLVLASSVSLGFLPVIAHNLKGKVPSFKQGKDGDEMYNPYLKDAPFWFVGLSASCLISTIIGMLIAAIPWHNVAWLYDTVQPKLIEDKDDLWVKTWGTPIQENHHGGQKNKKMIQQEENEWMDAHQHKYPTSLTRSLHLASTVLTGIVVITSYMVSAFVTGYTIVIANKDMDELDFDPRTKEIGSLDAFVVVFGSSSIMLLNICLLLYMVIRISDVLWHGKTVNMYGRGSMIPFLVKILAPYTMACSAKLLFDVQEIDSEMGEMTLRSLEERKIISCHLWMWMTLLTILVTIFSVFVNFYHKFPSWIRSFFSFIKRNICRRLEGDSSGGGVSKGLIRFLDTCGTLCALTGLILGISSLFIDQYDFTFEPQGTVKEIIKVCEDFQGNLNGVMNFLRKIISALDMDYTCEQVYTAVATGAGVTLFTSLIPGASGVSNIATKGAYYGVRAANSMTNLAKKLEKNRRKIWTITKAIIGITQFSVKNLKKIILGTNSISLMQLLPLFPPIYVGFRVFFGAFWPKRILFFSAKQRRKTTSGMFYDWLTVIILLLVTIAINTAVLDEIVAALNEELPDLARISINRKLGWRVAMAANAFAITSALANAVATFVLQWQTSKDHEHITNSELDWKEELKRRELEQIFTPHGVKLERRNQLKYKKERIGPWTWMVPILLVILACGFGVLANFHPKMEMAREPKGKFGKIIDKIYREISNYEDEVYTIKNDTSNECFPDLPTFGDIPNNPLVNPVTKFVDKALGLLKPVQDVVSGIRRQLLLDVDDELYNTENSKGNVWRENNLQYIGMILMVPRVICLIILIFGFFASSLFVCQMQIIECIEPRKLVNAFRNVTLFSVIYVVGAQLSLFNMISSFGVPFYHIYVRFGLGFVYDVVADSILVATCIGMQNEFFFAIPKRKTTVTYSIPGVSAEGPNIPGMII